MKKQTMIWHSKKYYLLGKDYTGTKYYLEKASWDCDWYWGFGYIETFTNNNAPHLSADISSHSHFDYMFMHKTDNTFDTFKKFFVDSTVNDNELFALWDYMRTYYILKDTAELYRNGYGWITQSAKLDALIDYDQEDHINKVLLPQIFDRIYKLLED